MNEKIVVIGGVAAGATAAAKARRTSENAHITLIEKGNFISYANCGLPYHVSGVIKKRNTLLLHTPRTFGRRFKTDVKINTEAVSINSNEKYVLVRDEEQEYRIDYDKLIIANGAVSVIPPVKGLNDVHYFSMRTVDDMDSVKSFIENNSPEHAVVVGGGYIGVETAEALMHCGLKVTLVEAANHIIPVFPPEVTLKIKETMVNSGIEIFENSMVTEVQKENNKIKILLNNGNVLTTDMLMLCTGVKPDTKLAETAGIDIGKAGGIRVNDKMETSVEYIYAAGDVTEKISKISGSSFLLPLAGPANRQGRVAGCNAAGGDLIFPPVVGTSIVGFEDACVAHTGLTYEEALKQGFDADLIYTEDAHRVTYYPEPKYIFIKLVFDKKTSRVLGATASGTVGVERRIDILSTAIYAGLTVYDLENLETCYAPQYGAAKDNVNIAGFVASNRLRKIGFGITPQEFLELTEDIQLVDVRTRIEFKIEKLDGAINLYLNELRDKLNKIDVSKPVYIYCTVGFRGFIAVRILRQLGYEAYNILGGIEAVKRLKIIK